MIRRIVTALFTASVFGMLAHAQAQLDPALLGKPPADSWPTYHGDYSRRHYSTLNQINQSTVKNLTLQWLYRANTNTRGAIAGAPGNYIVAYDPASGRQLWHAGFTAPVSNSPIRYMLDGRQQFIVAAGDTLDAFALQ